MRARFSTAVSPAKAASCTNSGASGGGGGPQPIDRVVGDRHQPAAGAHRRRLQRAHLRRGVQPRIEAEAAAARQRLGDEVGGRLAEDMADGKPVGIHLLLRLHEVAAVDEQRHGVGEHHRGAGGAGEPGQPTQPLLAGCHVLALMRVRPRHDKAGEPPSSQLAATACT